MTLPFLGRGEARADAVLGEKDATIRARVLHAKRKLRDALGALEKRGAR